MGSKVIVKFSTLSIKPVGTIQTTIFAEITFKLHIEVVDNEIRDLIYFASRDQRPRSNLTHFL